LERDPMDILELEKIKAEVQRHAATTLAREIISKMKPVADYAYIQQRLAEVTAAREIIQEFGNPPFGGIRDLREIVKKIEKGIVLTNGELVKVQLTLGGFRSLKTYFNEIVSNLDPELIEKRLGLVIDQGLKLTPLPKLEKELDRCLDEYGEIRNTASSRLSGIRNEITSLGNRIKDKMETIINNSRYQKMLQDTLITRRADRYVVPVKHEYRNIFSGIVHDQSASGMTLFMEPMAIIKSNNRLRELKTEEEKEVYRILKELTGKIGGDLGVIKNNLKLSLILDIILARTGYSLEISGIAPEINQNGVIRINQGRHPLLKTEPVPIDISVGDKFNTLIITGPNTGGKTVALKTVGLFVLMVEMGLHIPADRGTDISIFKDVFVDIGDEQSIEQNLSTFSSHINRIIYFLEHAGQNSLVLLDELGVGTDPKEGAALGIAVLERLRVRGSVTIATTHYSQLKSYAYSQPGVENASVEFDLDTLQPTYRLLMGIPGGSNAFAIARRLGMSAEIINEARKLLSGQEIEIENIINGLTEERKKYSELKEDFLQQKKAAEELKAKYENLYEDLQKEEREIMKEARLEAVNLVKQTENKTREIIQKLKETEFRSRPEIDRVANLINHDLQDLDQGLREDKSEIKDLVEQNISVGDRVRLKNLGHKGKVLEIDEEKKAATVQAGIMTIRADLAELIRIEGPEEQQEKLIKGYQVKKTTRVSSRLDLRGERYDLARSKLDKYLDDVFLAGLKQVEIIHGKGTGALREAVGDLLEDNPHISSYRLGRQEEGGSGVTIVTLK
jgi:DNA mismatch repair protein MutS2